MRNLLRTFVACFALAAAAPAAAQYTFTQPGQQPQPVQQLQLWNNVARVNVGVSFFNSGYYNCNYWGWYGYSCGSGSFVSYIPFTVGPQIDFNLQGMNNISVGFNVFLGTATGTVYNGPAAVSVSNSVTIWEPTIDYVAKFGPPSMDTVGRFRIGGGMYIGPNSELGGGLPHRRRRLVPELEPARHRPRPGPRGRRVQRLLDRRPAAGGLARVPLLASAARIHPGRTEREPGAPFSFPDRVRARAGSPRPARGGAPPCRRRPPGCAACRPPGRRSCGRSRGARPRASRSR